MTSLDPYKLRTAKSHIVKCLISILGILMIQVLEKTHFCGESDYIVCCVKSGYSLHVYLWRISGENPRKCGENPRIIYVAV